MHRPGTAGKGQSEVTGLIPGFSLSRFLQSDWKIILKPGRLDDGLEVEVCGDWIRVVQLCSTRGCNSEVTLADTYNICSHYNPNGSLSQSMPALNAPNFGT